MNKGEYRLDYILDSEGLHWWVITAANNEVTHKSEQGFASKQGAENNLAIIQSLRTK